MKTILIAIASALILVGLSAPAHATDPMPDYTAKRLTGPTTVVQGETFTRRLVIKNVGDGGGTWPVEATINQVPHATFVSVTSKGFDRCSPYYFASGALNYVRCVNAYLAPGQKAVMKVTYRAPVSGWLGYTYDGGGSVTKTSMELESDTTNNYLFGTALTEVIAAP